MKRYIKSESFDDSIAIYYKHEQVVSSTNIDDLEEIYFLDNEDVKYEY